MTRTGLQKTAMCTRLSCHSMANAPQNHRKDELPVFEVEPILSQDALRRVIRRRCFHERSLGTSPDALLSWSIKDLLNLQDK